MTFRVVSGPSLDRDMPSGVAPDGTKITQWQKPLVMNHWATDFCFMK